MDERNNMSCSDSEADDNENRQENRKRLKTDNKSIREPDGQSSTSSSSTSSSSSSSDSDHNDILVSPGSLHRIINPPDHSYEEEDSDSDLVADRVNFKVEQVLKKEKPKHNWQIVPELMNRQNGSNSKLQSHYLFQRRCYGSLHCVKRLELMYKLDGHYGCVNSLNFHQNGTLLASGSDDMKVILWDWKLGTSLLKITTHHTGNVFQSKFLNLSSDLHIVTCARDGQVRLIRVDEGVRENRKLGTHNGPCFKLALLKEQPHVILSAGEDGLVFSHDIREKREKRLVAVKKDNTKVPLYSIHTHPLKTFEYCVCGQDDTVKVFDQRKSVAPHSLYHPYKSDSGMQHITSAVYNYNGSEILASYNDSNIYLFDVNEPPGNFKHRYQGHLNDATIKGVNFFGPKSEYIVSGSDCGNIYFWEKNTESIVQCMLGDDKGVVNCLEPHPQVPFICTSGLDWDIKVWVPSCETDAELSDLSEKLGSNACKLPFRTDEDYQRLWMMLGPLRNNQQLRRFILFDDTATDSDISVDNETSEEEDGAEPTCTLS